MALTQPACAQFGQARHAVHHHVGAAVAIHEVEHAVLGATANDFLVHDATQQLAVANDGVCKKTKEKERNR